MKNKFYLILIFICCGASPLFSQNPTKKVSNLKTSWIGNSFPGGTKWVQHNILKAQVHANGEIHVYSNWDEAHQEGAKYQGKQKPDGSWYGDKIGYQSETDAYNNVKGDRVNIDGVVWYIEGYTDTENGNPPGRTDRWGRVVKKTGTDIVINDLEKATSLGIDRLNNLLMVTDDGPTRHTIRFYDTNGQFVKQLGIPGGIWPEQVGGDPTLNGVIDSDLKFWDLVGCGSDTNGNIIVVMSDIWKSSGAVIKAFNPAGTEMLWEIHGDPFCEVADFDRLVDGTIVHAPKYTYQMDYSKPSGKQYIKTAYTLNPYKYPNDFRLTKGSKNHTSSMVRYVGGKKFLYYTGMYGGLSIYKFNPSTDGEIAIPSEERFPAGGKNHLDVDDNGDYYQLLYNDQKIRKTPAIGVNGNGDIIWGTPVTYNKPSEFQTITACCYVGGTEDEMLVGGFFPGDADQTGWKQVSTRMVKYKNWNTNPTKVWSHHFTEWYHMDAQPVGKRRVNKSIQAIGEYVFVDWLSYNYNGSNRQDSPGVIEVFRVDNGQWVGEIFAGPEVMNQSSWHDLLISFHVMQRENGEYLILSEENWKSKHLLFRWCPSGDCSENSFKLSMPTDGKQITPGETVNLGVENNTPLEILKVEYLADNNVIAESVLSPFSANYTFSDESIVNLSARYILSTNDTIYSTNSSKIYVYNPRLNSLNIFPRDNTISITDSIQLQYKAFDQFSFPIQATPLWTTSNGATITENGWFKPNGIEGSFIVIAKDGDVADTIIVHAILYVPTSIKIFPVEPVMHIGSKIQLHAEAYDQLGNMIYAITTFNWQVLSGMGEVDETGLFTAGNVVGEVSVSASLEQISEIIDITILPAAGWVNQDIGPVGKKGNVLIDDEKGEFIVTASGSDIWVSSDEFHYVFRPLAGDGQITARVDSFNYTDSWTKIGVMIRESTHPSSAHASTLITSTQGLISAYRLASGGGSARSAKLMVVTPYWLRISRSGNTFTSSESADGNLWKIVQAITIPMADTVLIGLAATSHNNDSIVTVKYSNVVSSGFDPIRVTGISLNSSSLTMYPTQQSQLIASIAPLKPTISTLTWSSSNNGVASVAQNGLVTAVGVGSAVISATTLDGEYKANCTVSVILTSVRETGQDYNFNVYPNPLSNGNLTVHLGYEIHNATLSVHSIDGQLVYLEDFSGVSKEISGNLFNKGVYIITLKNNQGTFNKLFIKQ